MRRSSANVPPSLKGLWTSLKDASIYFPVCTLILLSSAIPNYSSFPFNFAFLTKDQNIKIPNPLLPTTWQGKPAVGH